MKTALEALYLLMFLPTVFSLKCFQCLGSSSACRMTRKVCATYETTCLSLAYISMVNGASVSDMVLKGCASTALCNQTSAVDNGQQGLYMTSTCCESDYCNYNRFPALSVASKQLQCNGCTNPIDCQQPSLLLPVTCTEINNQCVDVVSRLYNGNQASNFYSKGCGSADVCNSLISYDTGSVQLYTQFQCCSNIDFCNSATVNVPIPPNKNGILCLGCNETGLNECAPQNQVQVHCSGSLIRCMEIFEGPNRKTVKKGCCTENLCSETYPALTIPNVTEIQCCAGNLCNTWPKQYACPEDYSTSWRPRGSPGLLLVLLCSSLLRILL